MKNMENAKAQAMKKKTDKNMGRGKQPRGEYRKDKVTKMARKEGRGSSSVKESMSEMEF